MQHSRHPVWLERLAGEQTHTILRHMHGIVSQEFLRFLAVGALNSLFGYGVFALFLSFGLSYKSALLVATVLGVLFNFRTTGTFVFKSRENHRLLRFTCTYIALYFIHIGCLKSLLLLGFSAYLGGALLVAPMALLAYLLNKRFVFTHD